MKTPKQSGKLLAELRKIINKSQTQFAAMIGVSKHTIISVENNRNQLRRKLADKIQIATGANLLEGKLESPFKVEDYTRKDFERWLKRNDPSTDAAALKLFDEKKTWLKFIFLAAAKSARAGNTDRLPAVCLSLVEWLNQARKKFNLENQIEDILHDETRILMTGSYVIPALLQKPKVSKAKLAEHDIDFNKIRKKLKIHARDGFLFIQDEFRSVWSPGDNHFCVPCRPRELIPHAKCWIKKFKGNLSSLEETGHSHVEWFKYVRKVNENLAFAESEYAENSLQS